VGALLRTAVFTIPVPGTVLVLIPHTPLPRGARWHADALGIFAAILGVAGTAIYSWCALWAFAAAGGGTPAPIDPPKRLVVHGLYRKMRNPMYAGVGSILAAEAIGFRSSQLTIYWAICIVCVNLFVLFYEELTLRRKFGDEYEQYCRRVPRWLPRLNG
jgi:protein-S-isoprenylcysteine O-methyltransferase Ste14